MEESQNTPIEEEKNLLDEFKKLKENSVSIEKYKADIEELKEKNQLYLKAITEGGKVPQQEEPDIPLDERIERLSRFRGTNLDYWNETTKAIDQLFQKMSEEEINSVTGQDGLDELLEVRNVMRQMVDDANGDPDYFIKLYKQRVKDSAPKISADIEKAGGLVNYLQNK
jgi:hypothetical protein